MVVVPLNYLTCHIYPADDHPPQLGVLARHTKLKLIPLRTGPLFCDPWVRK